VSGKQLCPVAQPDAAVGMQSNAVTNRMMKFDFVTMDAPILGRHACISCISCNQMCALKKYYAYKLACCNLIIGGCGHVEGNNPCHCRTDATARGFVTARHPDRSRQRRSRDRFQRSGIEFRDRVQCHAQRGPGSRCARPGRRSTRRLTAMTGVQSSW